MRGADWVHEWFEHDGKYDMGYLEFDDYPHLFKKLQWWEERKEEDMPKYLKHTFNGETEYFKIEKWDTETMFGYVTFEGRSGCSLRSWNDGFGYYPATEEEYNSFISIKL